MWKKRNSGTPNSPTPITTFKAHMVGLESVFFTTGTSKHAANYLVVKQNIERYVGTQGYCGTAVAPRGIKEVVPPVCVKPELPEKKQAKIGLDKNAQTDALTRYSTDLGLHVKDTKEYTSKVAQWEEN